MQGVLDAGLGLLHLGLGAAADRDHRHAAGELGQPLLELLAVVVAVAGFDLPLELLDAGLDVGRLAGAFDDRRVVLVDRDLLRPAELLQREVLELQAEVLADDRAGGEDADVAQQGLAAIAEAGGLHGGRVEHAAELVHHQGREGLALDVLGDDQAAACRSGRPSPGAESGRGCC